MSTASITRSFRSKVPALAPRIIDALRAGPLTIQELYEKLGVERGVRRSQGGSGELSRTDLKSRILSVLLSHNLLEKHTVPTPHLTSLPSYSSFLSNTNSSSANNASSSGSSSSSKGKQTASSGSGSRKEEVRFLGTELESEVLERRAASIVEKLLKKQQKRSSSLDDTTTSTTTSEPSTSASTSSTSASDHLYSLPHHLLPPSDQHPSLSDPTLTALLQSRLETLTSPTTTNPIATLRAERAAAQIQSQEDYANSRRLSVAGIQNAWTRPQGVLSIGGGGEGAEKWVTSEGERGHLNKRRGARRVGKERGMVGWLGEVEEARRGGVEQRA